VPGLAAMRLRDLQALFRMMAHFTASDAGDASSSSARNASTPYASNASSSSAVARDTSAARNPHRYRFEAPRFACILDTRPLEAFLAGHLPCSVSIPRPGLEARRHELPPRARVFIVVDDDPQQARETAEWLHAHGWPDLYHLDESLSAWEGPWERGPSARALWEPTELVGTWAGQIPSGSVLDLGCGAGRDAVHLAQLGHPVIAVDRLADALAMACSLARRHGVTLTAVEADVRKGPPPLPAEADPRESGFAAIVMIRLVAAPLLPWVAERIAPGGLVLLEAFTPEQVERRRMRRLAHTLSLEQALAAFPGWEILARHAGADANGDFVTQLVARKPLPLEVTHDPDHD
jgi:SAM-dependent methyltransferase